MIEFSGQTASRLALLTLKSLQKVVEVIRSDNTPFKIQHFLESFKGTLDRSKLLADIVRKEAQKPDNAESTVYLAQLQKLENQVVVLRGVLIETLRLAKKGLQNNESVSIPLNNCISSVVLASKDVIKIAKEFPKEKSSIMETIHETNKNSSESTHDDSPGEMDTPAAVHSIPTITEERENVPNTGTKSRDSLRKSQRGALIMQPIDIAAGIDVSEHASSESSHTKEQKSENTNEDKTPETPTDKISEIQKSSDETDSKQLVIPTPEVVDYVIELFNKKWKSGIQYLISEKIIKEDAKSIARFLVEYNERLSKEMLGEILAGKNEDDVELLTEFTSMLNFKGDTFDLALRKYLTKFMLPGEAQKISRMMEVFASEFLGQNPKVFPNKDVAFVLAFSLIMLNTDAHNPAIAAKDKMTKEQFIWNNRGTWVDGADPPKELLEDLYDKIVNDEIKMQTKGDPDKKGFLKGLHGGTVREGRRWFVLMGNELKWYKNPNTKAEDDLKGKIILDFVQIKEELTDCKIDISSVLPNKNIDFFVYEGRHNEKVISCKKLVLSAENSAQCKAWASSVRANVTLENLMQLDNKNQSLKNVKRRKPDPKKKNQWRTSVNSNISSGQSIQYSIDSPTSQSVGSFSTSSPQMTRSSLSSASTPTASPPQLPTLSPFTAQQSSQSSFGPQMQVSQQQILLQKNKMQTKKSTSSANLERSKGSTGSN